jgi:3-oxoacyl-[acyl-carrier-protein] synthase-3
VSPERYARLTGIGSALPSRRVPNAYFETIVQTSDEWIAERTGIRERRFAEEGETTSTLGAAAARVALESAGLEPAAIDLLIVATCTPDRPLPSSASLMQAMLGLTCPAFDLNAACAGFVYGLSVGGAQIAAGAADRVLVVGSETLSRVINMTDRTTCVLFADGAGAVVLEPGDEPGLMASKLALDGTHADLLTIRAGGSAEPATAQGIAEHRTQVHMADGQAVFRLAVVAMAEACRELLEKSGVAPGDVDVVIAHQANARIIAAVGKRLGIDPARLVIDIADVGNTSAASIPIAMDRAWRAGKVGPGDIVLTTAFGAGLSWGANLLRWTAPRFDEAARA